MTSNTFSKSFDFPFTKTRNAVLPLTLLALSILAYLFLSIYNIQFPGLYYDEALFINAALGGKYSNEFIAARIFEIPVMTMPYIGALKSFVYAPIFALLGVNIYTIRVPAILISCVTLFIAYLILRQFVSKRISASTVLLLGTDPAFIFHTRVDHGPIVMMLLLKLTAIYLFLRALSENSWKCLSLSYVFLLLGLWDKLNFAWVIVACVVASAVYAQNVVQIVSRNKVQFALSSILFACALGFMYVALIRPLSLESTPATLDVCSRFIQLAAACQSTLTGEAFCRWVFDKPIPRFEFSPNYLGLVAICPLLGIWSATKQTVADPRGRSSKLSKGICFFAILFFTIFFQIVLTPQAGGPHHFMVVWPFHYFVCALAFGMLVERYAANRNLALAAARFLIVSILLLSTYRIWATASAISAFKTEPVRAIWAPSIYSLARLMRGTAYGNCSIVTVDWGIGTQVSALTHPLLRFKYRDLWTMFNVLKPVGYESDWLSRMTKSGPIYMVLYAPGLAVFPEARRNMFNFARTKRLQCVLFAEVKDGAKRCFEVYKISATPTPTPVQP